MSEAPEIRCPGTLADAVSILAASDDAMCLSGGATLVAMLNADLIAPASLVSLKSIGELQGITRNDDGAVVIGAMTRHCQTAASDVLTGSLSGLREAASKIANPTVRNMGTMGGSISFADPGADYLPALAAAEAQIELVSATGSRRVAAADFFLDWYETARRDDEIVRAIQFPAPDNNAYGVHEKFARVEGDFATVSVNVVLRMERDTCAAIRIAVGACGPRPVRLAEAEALLVGKPLDRQALLAAGSRIAEACDPVDDARGSARYRLNLIPQLVARAALRARHVLQSESVNG